LVRRLDSEHDQRGDADSGTAQSVPTEKTLKQAVERFLAGKGTIQPDGSYHGDVERNTFRKYSTSLTLLCRFCDERAISVLADVGVDALRISDRHVRSVS
jgi:hypothetical protein